MIKFNDKLKFDHDDILQVLAIGRNVSEILDKESYLVRPSDLQCALNDFSDALSDLITHAIESMGD
jgi:hypothetical protein